jgi:hypothetical protein
MKILGFSHFLCYPTEKEVLYFCVMRAGYIVSIDTNMEGHFCHWLLELEQVKHNNHLNLFPFEGALAAIIVTILPTCSVTNAFQHACGYILSPNTITLSSNSY